MNKISAFDALLLNTTTQQKETKLEKEDSVFVWKNELEVVEKVKEQPTKRERPTHTPKKKVSSKNITLTSTKAYNAESKEELSFPENTKITMVEIDPAGWVFGKYNKEFGWFPLECVNFAESNDRRSLLVTNQNKEEIDNSNIRKSMYANIGSKPIKPEEIPVEKEQPEEQDVPTCFPEASNSEYFLNKVIFHLKDLEGSIGKNKKMLTTYENSILGQKILTHIKTVCGGDNEALQMCQVLENRG